MKEEEEKEKIEEGWKEEEKEGEGEGEKLNETCSNQCRIKLAAQAQRVGFARLSSYELRKLQCRPLPFSRAVKSHNRAEQLATFQTFSGLQPTGEDQLSPTAKKSRIGPLETLKTAL